eukprot:COSAG02_NODE_58998_length_275_cov_1.170455_1_plen_53_part_01
MYNVSDETEHANSESMSSTQSDRTHWIRQLVLAVPKMTRRTARRHALGRLFPM